MKNRNIKGSKGGTFAPIQSDCSIFFEWTNQIAEFRTHDQNAVMSFWVVMSQSNARTKIHAIHLNNCICHKYLNTSTEDLEQI